MLIFIYIYIYIYIYILLLSERQTGEAWEPSNKQRSFIHGKLLSTRIKNSVPSRTDNMLKQSNAQLINKQLLVTVITVQYLDACGNAKHTAKDAGPQQTHFVVTTCAVHSRNGTTARSCQQRLCNRHSMHYVHCKMTSVSPPITHMVLSYCS
jgi:hypothetical protein